MAKITYTKDSQSDGKAQLYIDGEVIESSTFKTNIADNIHAIQWNGTSGEIEYNDGTPNKTISDITPFDFETQFTYAYSKQVGLQARGPWELKKDFVQLAPNQQIYEVPDESGIHQSAQKLQTLNYVFIIYSCLINGKRTLEAISPQINSR